MGIDQWPQTTEDIEMSKIVKALQNVIVITPDIRIWSGRVSVKRNEDLISASGLPPEQLVSDGAKRVIDPKVLTPLESHRRCVSRYLARVGIRSTMGYLIQPEKEQEVHDELARRQAQFDDAKAELIAGYDALVRTWETKIPGFEGLLRRNRPNAIEVAAACEFDYATYRLVEAESEEGKQRFEAVGKAATSALVADVTTSAASLYRDSFQGKQKVTQRAVNVVRELITKLRDFSMFDPRVGPTADALEKVLKDVPHKGPLAPTETLIVGALLRSMRDPDELLRHGRIEDAVHGDEDDSEGEELASIDNDISDEATKSIPDNESAVPVKSSNGSAARSAAVF